MYQKNKHSKNKSVFSRSAIAAFAALGIVASPFLLTGIVQADEGGMHDKSASPSISMPMPMDHKAMSPGSQELQESMMKGMKEMESMSMMGNPDQDFAMMMIKHHKAALDMAKIELKHGKDPKLRSMANEIIASQKAEIKQFEQWLDKHMQSMAKPMPKSQ
ncbi:MAG: DUF305 domain-containing protein [Gammaproteobacteria bacterium]